MSQFNRPSLFSDAQLKDASAVPMRESWFRDTELESMAANQASSNRYLFSASVILVKIAIPMVMYVGFTEAFLLWEHWLFHQVLGDAHTDATWYGLMIPCTYFSGIVIVGLFLYILAWFGLFNFRSGMMDYYSIGFFHWYIFTDIMFGWVQMVMSPASGTAFYSWWMAWMGATVGNNAYVDMPGGLREVTNIIIDEESVLLTRFIFAHYIDHGKLQFAPVVISSDVCINKECMIMPLTTYESGVSLRPYSSTIKGQTFGSDRIFQGHPATKMFAVKPQEASIPAYSSNLPRMTEESEHDLSTVSPMRDGPL